MVVIFFIIGLIVGSFLNVAVMRMRHGEQFMSGRSRCPQCKKQLAWHDNIPLLSFVILRGQCRHCHKKISWRYPLTELLTGAVFASIFLRVDFLTQPTLLFLTLLFFALLLIVFFYDLHYMEIPMTALWGSLVVAVIIALLHDNAMDGSILTTASQTVQGLLSGLGAFAFFYALSAYSNETWMGKGDAYVGLVMGVFLGWPSIFIGLLVAFFVGAVVGVLLIMFCGKNGKTQIPFGPFMLFGMWCAFFFQEKIAFFSDLLQI